MSRSDWLAIFIAVISMGGGGYMATFSRAIVRVLGVIVIFLGIGGLVLLWTGRLPLSDSEASTSTQTINAPSNSGIITEGQTGGTNNVR